MPATRNGYSVRFLIFFSMFVPEVHIGRTGNQHDLVDFWLSADLVISMGEHADLGVVLIGTGPDWTLPAAGNCWVRGAGASRRRGCRSFLSCLARRVMACAAGVRAAMPPATTVARSWPG
jgi:hypothetical protein